MAAMVNRTNAAAFIKFQGTLITTNCLLLPSKTPFSSFQLGLGSAPLHSNSSSNHDRPRSRFEKITKLDDALNLFDEMTHRRPLLEVALAQLKKKERVRNGAPKPAHSPKLSNYPNSPTQRLLGLIASSSIFIVFASSSANRCQLHLLQVQSVYPLLFSIFHLTEQKEKAMENKKGSKMNIAIIHPDLGIGGAERLIVDAAVELASHGHNVHIFTSHHDRSRCFEETLAGTFAVTVYGSFLPRHIFYRLHAVCAYLRCMFVALCVLFMWPSFDVVLADQVSVVIPVLKFRKSTKVVFYCHFPDLLLAKHTTLLRRIYRIPINFLEELTTGMADMILVNSKFTASTFAATFKHLDAKGIRPSVLYPAVNVDQFSQPNAYKLNFLSINRFERKKNIDLAISAFAMLRCPDGNISESFNFADVTLTIAGGFDQRLRENVEYLEQLKVLAEIKGVSNQVKFITSCPTAERNALLSDCLCVIYTPKDEHFGIVPLEAMAAHKPVIACNSGGPVETVKDGETGFLCDPTPQNFSSAMAKFLKDPSLAERMGTKARSHVATTFSTKTFGERLNQYLVDVVVQTQSKQYKQS